MLMQPQSRGRELGTRALDNGQQRRRVELDGNLDNLAVKMTPPAIEPAGRPQFNVSPAVQSSRRRPLYVACPACGSPAQRVLLQRAGTRFVACRACALAYADPVGPLVPETFDIARTDHWKGELDQSLACRNFANAVAELADAYTGIVGRAPRRLLVIGRWHSSFKELALAIPEVEFAADVVDEISMLAQPLLEVLGDRIGRADVILLNGFLEARTNPASGLAGLAGQLKPDALLAIAFASTRSVVSKVLRKRWRGFFDNAIAFYDSENLNILMSRCGFDRVAIWRMQTLYSLGYAIRRLGLSTSLQRFLSVTRLAALRAATPAGYQLAVFRPHDGGARDTLSIVVPVFNEASSVGAILSTLTTLKLPLDYEIVVVESGSTDGSREVVESFASSGRVHAIFQEEARGKGNAVRAGIAAATGRIIMIQDADFEYDLDDYAALLAPIIQRHASFVLGSRTLGLDDWRIRQYVGTPFRGALVNVGQVVFERTFNLLYRQKTTDIHTMFKVFRRECIDGLEFTSDRFNFDIELVCKIVRNGHVPMEVPVNYQGRGFDEGKKVTFADAWPNYFQLFRCRFQRSRSQYSRARHGNAVHGG